VSSKAESNASCKPEGLYVEFKAEGVKIIMKKTIILSLVAATLVASSCFGIEVLSPGTTVGAGKFTVGGFYSSTSIQMADTSILQYGMRAIYGMTPDLDVIGKLGLGTAAGLNSSTIGAGIKYAFLKVSANDPVDLSGLINFESISGNTYTLGNTSIGIVASKDLKNLITIYGLANVILTSAKFTGLPSSSGTGLQVGAGFRLQINTETEFMSEISMYNVDSNSYATVAFGLQFMLM
jgi:hypothetical protein